MIKLGTNKVLISEVDDEGDVEDEIVEGDYPSEDEELSLRINDKLSHMNAVILHYNQ